MRRRIVVAVTVAGIGSVVYMLVQRVLGEGGEPFLPSWGLAGLLAGAMGSTMVCYDPRRIGMSRNVLQAMAIVGLTLPCISVSAWIFHGLSRPPFDVQELVGMVLSHYFFGMIYAVWWLVPGLATILWAVDRLFPHVGGVRDSASGRAMNS